MSGVSFVSLRRFGTKRDGFHEGRGEGSGGQQVLRLAPIVKEPAFRPSVDAALVGAEFGWVHSPRPMSILRTRDEGIPPALSARMAGPLGPREGLGVCRGIFEERAIRRRL